MTLIQRDKLTTMLQKDLNNGEIKEMELVTLPSEMNL